MTSSEKELYVRVFNSDPAIAISTPELLSGLKKENEPDIQAESSMSERDLHEMLDPENRSRVPDAVIIDADFGNLQGPNFVERIRRDKRFESTAILVTGNYDAPPMMERVMKQGADVYLLNPVGANQLRSAVVDFVRSKRQRKSSA